jgi:tripartite-type tricarboxylate transporter receptor subunit TctC
VGVAVRPFRDFESLVAQIPNFLLVHPSVPATTVRELVAFAKRGIRGKIGSGGVGTSGVTGNPAAFFPPRR